MKHSETEKDYLVKESELMKGVSVAEFELDGLMQVEGKGSSLNLKTSKLICLEVQLRIYLSY